MMKRAKTWVLRVCSALIVAIIVEVIFYLGSNTSFWRGLWDELVDLVVGFLGWMTTSIPVWQAITLAIMPLIIFGVYRFWRERHKSEVVVSQRDESPMFKVYKNIRWKIERLYSNRYDYTHDDILDCRCAVCGNYFEQTVKINKKWYVVCENKHFVGGDMSPTEARKQFEEEYKHKDIVPYGIYYVEVLSALQEELVQKLNREKSNEEFEAFQEKINK